MTLEEFATITRRVIAKDGFEDHLPTAAYPSQGLVRVLEGAPPGRDIASAAREWAERHAKAGEEYLLAFKVSATSFRVERRLPDGRVEEGLFDAFPAKGDVRGQRER